MNTLHNRFRLAAALVAAALIAGISGAIWAPAHAGGSFTLTRVQGADRFQTAGAAVGLAFPSGATTVLLADAIPGHQSDALAASGLEGAAGIGALLTDNTDSVPANTLSALSANKVRNIAVLGGTAAVSSAQVKQLQSKGYNVSQPYQGTTRYQTMQLIDQSITAAKVGKDAAGNPTAILASGDNAHFVDALSAGGLAFAEHFPVILTNSQGPGLQPEAQQVIANLGIKHLIVVGGTSSIPASEYTPPPSGVTTVDVEAGTNRSATSSTLADFAIKNGWLKDTNMTVARGDDGSDALAGAALSGVNGYPTVITNSPQDAGSTTSWAQAHQATLAGNSYVFGGPAAVPDSQVTAIEQAAGAASSCPAGAISGSAVTSVGGGSFTQGGCNYATAATDTYQLMQTPSGSLQASCQADSYADFATRLTSGDQVTGTYAPGKGSTFCLNDAAAHPPSSVTAVTNGTAGGVTVSWSAPSTLSSDAVQNFVVWRAPATPPAVSGFPATCPNVYTVAPGTSPQTPPASPYVQVGQLPVSGNASTTTWTYNDTSASPGTGTTPNQYCYGVSSTSTSQSGAPQVGTAAPANASASPATAAAPGPVTAGAAGSGGAAPTMTSVSFVGQTVALTYDQPIDPATVDLNGSDFIVQVSQPNGVTATATTAEVQAFGAGNQVFIDINPPNPGNTSFPGIQGATGDTVKVTAQSGADGNSVCSPNSSSVCEANVPPAQDSRISGPWTAAPSNPTMSGATGSATAQTINVTYGYPIDCTGVDPGGAKPSDYSVNQGGSGINGGPVTINSAACLNPVNGRSSTVQLKVAGMALGATLTVSIAQAVPSGTTPPPYKAGFDGNTVFSSLTGGVEPFTDTVTGPVNT